jgi:hypothetical protein
MALRYAEDTAPTPSKPTAAPVESSHPVPVPASMSAPLAAPIQQHAEIVPTTQHISSYQPDDQVQYGSHDQGGGGDQEEDYAPIGIKEDG